METAFGDPAKVTAVWKWVAASGKRAIYAPDLDAATLAAQAAEQGHEVLTSVQGGEGFWVTM